MSTTAIVLLVVWIMFMVFWLVFGCSTNWDPTKPRVILGSTVVPWVCVFILGLIVFGAFGPVTVRTEPASYPPTQRY